MNAVIPSDAERNQIGARVPRHEGVAKVRGEARYAVEHPVDGLLHAVVVQSSIAAGRVLGIDSHFALALPGVHRVFTHEDALPIKRATGSSKGGAAVETFVPLQSDVIRFSGQHLAVVVADTLEQATEAARMVRVTVEADAAIAGLDDPAAQPGEPIKRATIAWGDAPAALAAAPVQMSATYTTPRAYNVPMEPHGTIAAWDEAGGLTVWEPSQWVDGARRVFSEWFDIPIDQVRVISPYVGGGFGCKGNPHAHAALAAAVARVLARPVKLVLTRAQTFTGFGGRPATSQTLSLGADRDGRLQAIVHESRNETSFDDDYVESCNAATAITYAVPNFASSHRLVQVHTVSPGWMRAPGENPSAWALESAMDELAYAVDLDPIELRLRNWTDVNPKAGKPWSTRQLREAYAAGAEAFGWSQRSPRPRSMRVGRELVGWGIAGGTYPVHRTPSEARVRLLADGTVEVESSGADLGTGTYTILAQTAADVLGAPVDSVRVRLGDSQLPRAPVAGGSQLAGLLTGAVNKAAVMVREAVFKLAAEHPASPLHQRRTEDFALRDSRIVAVGGRTVDVVDLLRMTGQDGIDILADTLPVDARSPEDRLATFTSMSRMLGPTQGDFAMHAWNAQFVEVRVDEDFGTLRVTRMVGAFDSGRLYNPRLAESQWIGGMIMGLGQALLEGAQIDPRHARVTNNNLADYLVAVNADVPDIQVISVGVPDLHASALGGKAVGELGIVGTAAAIANAVYHATGKRVRDLPITLAKLV